MRRKQQPPEVVYVERGGDASARWLFWGACLGAGLALLYAPRSGEETRRVLQRRLWKIRAMTEEKVDELVEQFGPRRGASHPAADDEIPTADMLDEDEDLGDLPPAALERGRAAPSAREELERRLADARARRRREATPSGEFEEPLA
jgi:hypothetical protein